MRSTHILVLHALLLILAAGITHVWCSVGSSSSSSSSSSSTPSALKRARSFQSAAFHHIEHVEWYQLDHKDQQEHTYNTKSVHRGSGLLSHVAYPYASRRMHMYEGMQLHFPTSLTLAVKALGQTFHLNLHAVTELKSAETEVIVAGERHPVTLSTYRTIPTQADDIRATVTFRKDGSFQALLITQDEIIGIDPVEAHAQEMEVSHYHSMATSAPHGMVAYKYSDAKPTHTHSTNELIKSKPLTPQEMRRHLLAVINDPANWICNGVPCRWLDNGQGAPCWPGITATNAKSMTVSVLADYGYTQIWRNHANTIAAIDQTYAVVNSIYVPQIGIYCKLMQYVVMSAGTDTSGVGSLPNTKPGWNYAWNRAPASKGGRCDRDDGYGIDSYLYDITTYNTQHDVTPSGIIRFAERHAFTNCYPGPGTMELAWMETVASKSGRATLVASYSTSHWLSVARSQGHNLGAPSTFGPNGTSSGGVFGLVGGLMDLSLTGKYPRPESGKPGIPQFHPILSRPPICKQLNKSMSDTRQSQYMSSYFQTWTPTCGNNVLEPGEDCDDTSGCCDLTTCRLVAGGQCTPGNNNSPCCDSTCLYRSTRYGCPGGSSYCLMGRCAVDGCTKYSNTAQCPASPGLGITQYLETTNPPITYPGIAMADGCNFGCSFNGGDCGKSGQGIRQPASFGTVPDGAVCTSATTTGAALVTYGVCSGGGDGTGASARCVPTTPPTAPTKYQVPTTTAPTTPPPSPSPTPRPTTQAPTTLVPTTSAPTTEDPTTLAPTTEAPATEAPATAAPTTEAPTPTPTTSAPTTEVPTTLAPATSAPTTSAPTTEAPATETPTTEAPTTEAPTTGSPTTNGPATDAPTTDAPAAEAPSTQAPTPTPVSPEM